MPKNSFDETPTGKALRLALGSDLRTSAQRIADFDASVGTRNALAEFRRQEQLLRNVHELFDPPTLRMAREAAEAWKQQDEAFRKAVLPLSQALAAFDQDMHRVTQAHDAFTRDFSRSVGGVIDEYDRRIREITAPLADLARSLELQQQGFAAAIAGVGGERWSQFATTAAALRGYYLEQFEAGEFDEETADAARAAAVALEAVAPGEKPDAAAVLALLNLLIGLAITLAKNTGERVRKLDIIEILLIAATIKSLFPDYTTEDREVAGKTLEAVERIEERAKEVAKTEAAEYAWVNALPRAIVTGAGRIREAPSSDARIRTKLRKETVVAISARRGRWRQVVFHDEVTDRFGQGWVYAGSLKDL